MSVMSFLNLKTGVAAAALITLAACGGAEDTTQSDTPVDAPAETMEPVAVMPTITPNKAPSPAAIQTRSNPKRRCQSLPMARLRVSQISLSL